jgi:hypothetical protein
MYNAKVEDPGIDLGWNHKRSNLNALALAKIASSRHLKWR